MPSGSDDARIAWIQGRVILGLGLDDPEFEYMLVDAPPRAAEIMRDFLGSKAGVGSSLFFYPEMENVEESEEYDEEYQEEVVIEVAPPLDEPDDVDGVVSNEDKAASSTKPLTENDGPAPAEGGSVSEDPAAADERGPGPSVDEQKQLTNHVRTVTKTRKAIRTVCSTKRRCRMTQGNLPDSERVVYFVKIVGGEVMRPISGSDHENMVAAMEYGCLAGDCLTNLSAVIKEVFAPLLDHQLGLGVLALSAPTGGDRVLPDAAATVPQDALKVGDNLRNEFRANLHKFESQVTHATQQVKGDVHLSVPNINIDDPDIGNDFEAVSLLEGAMEEWSRLIAAVVEAENLKRVKGKGPMAEIEFWRRRNASLSALYEQINMPKVTYPTERRVERTDSSSTEVTTALYSVFIIPVGILRTSLWTVIVHVSAHVGCWP